MEMTLEQMEADVRRNTLQESIDKSYIARKTNIGETEKANKDKVYNIVPVPKPRMTGRDKWLHPPRPCVARYRAFKDEVRLARIEIPDNEAHIFFFIPVPKSWSNQKQQEMIWKPHQQTPDIDNYLKALLDSVFDNDSHIWDIRATKMWAKDGAIEIGEI